MSAITTHVLDLARGRPAGGVPVVLEYQTGTDAWQVVGQGMTDEDGRLKSLFAPDERPQTGVYRLTFDTDAYFRAQQIESFYPHVSIVFALGDSTQHYHVPLLLSPFGYSTYRGS